MELRELMMLYKEYYYCQIFLFKILLLVKFFKLSTEISFSWLKKVFSVYICRKNII